MVCLRMHQRFACLSTCPLGRHRPHHAPMSQTPKPQNRPSWLLSLLGHSRTHTITHAENTHRQQTHAYMHPALPPSTSFSLILRPWLGPFCLTEAPPQTAMISLSSPASHHMMRVQASPSLPHMLKGGQSVPFGCRIHALRLFDKAACVIHTK